MKLSIDIDDVRENWESVVELNEAIRCRKQQRHHQAVLFILCRCDLLILCAHGPHECCLSLRSKQLVEGLNIESTLLK